MNEKCKGKIFCKDCVWLSISLIGPFEVFYCKCPKNVTVDLNFYSCENRYNDPQIINKNNDCKNFEYGKWFKPIQRMIKRRKMKKKED